MKSAVAILAGCALLTAASILRLPGLPELRRAPATPFERTLWLGAGPGMVLVSRADGLLPRGSTVEVDTADAAAADSLAQLAAGLLPGRRVRRLRDRDPRARYRLVFGNPSSAPAGRLLLSLPQGSLWRIGP